MSQLKEDQLISQPAPCSSNSWAVINGRENVIAEPPPLPAQCFIACILVTEVTDTGCLRKNALLGFLNPWDRLMPVVTIVLVKVVGEMLDDD